MSSENLENSAELHRLEPESGEYRRYHSLIILLEGWTVLLAFIGFGISFALDISDSISLETIVNWIQNSYWLFLIVLGALLYGLAGIIKWFTVKWAINEHGVFERSKLISVNRRIAPRERIEAVSIERSFWARIWGLSSLKIELAGAGDSYFTLEYLGRKEAEEIYNQILTFAKGKEVAQSQVAGQNLPEAALNHEALGAVAVARQIAFEGDDQNSVQLAKIPTSRLLNAMLRDVGLLLGVIFSAIFAIIWLTWQIIDGFELSFTALAVAVPIVFAAPKILFEHLEAGWGFISRATEKGMKARRGLFSTHNDNISAERIQTVDLSRSALWVGQQWTKLTISTSGVDGLEEETSTKVLPVGEPAEVKRTLEQIFPGIGSIAQVAGFGQVASAPQKSVLAGLENEELMLAVLHASPDEVGGFKVEHWSYPLARRLRRLHLTDKAVLVRSGWLIKRVSVLQREKIQQVSLVQGPLQKHWGIASVGICTAGNNVTFALDAQDALAIVNLLSQDAGISRRYSERENWTLPRLQHSPQTVKAH